MPDKIRDLILAGDPVATVEYPPTVGLMPLYICWDPDPATLDASALRALIERGPAIGAAGIDAAVARLRAAENKDIADNSLALAVVDDGRDYEYRHYGVRVSASSGRDFTGGRVSTMAAHSASAKLYGPGYDAVVRRGLPLYSENANTSGLVVQTWRRLIVPTIDKDGKVDGFIVGNVAGHGLPSWPVVLPKAGSGAPPNPRFETARDRFSGLSAIDLTRQMEGAVRGLLGVGQVGVGILSFDLRAFRYVGPHLAGMLGKDSVAMTRENAGAIFGDRAAFDAVAAIFAGGATHHEVETELRRSDGSRMYARLSFGAMDYNMSPAVALWVADLSDHKRLEDDLAAARAAAERADRARQRLFASLAHDLRTPINAVLGFSDALAALPKIDEARTREYGALISRAGRMLSTLINDLLDLSRMEAGKYRLTPIKADPTAPVAGAIEVVKPLAWAKRVEIRADLAPCPPVVHDPDALSRIAVNLLSNAIKFTPEGGKIDVTLAPGKGGGLRLAVADTGRGIAPEALARIMDPFEQADAGADHKTGSGLGLSIVRGLVDLHGGQVEVRSAVGKGTTVEINLP